LYKFDECLDLRAPFAGCSGTTKKRQVAGNKRNCSLRVAAIAGGPRALVCAFACTASINVLALTGAAYMLLLYGRVVPAGDRTELIAATLTMFMLYGLGAATEIARQKLILRGALRLRRGLRAIAARRVSPAPARDLSSIDKFLMGPAPASLFDVPWIPLYVGVLLWLHPMLCVVAVAGSASVAACLLLADARGLKPESAGGRAMLAAGTLRALRPALQSTMLGLGAYLVMAGACHPGCAFAAAIVLQRMLGPIEAIVAHWRSLADAHDSARRLLSLLSAPGGAASVKAVPLAGRTAPREVRIVLRRSSDYARSASRGGATSASSGFRPTAQ
jgi:ATP-binding cassette subfamily C protein